MKVSSVKIRRGYFFCFAFYAEIREKFEMLRISEKFEMLRINEKLLLLNTLKIKWSCYNNTAKRRS